MDLYLENLKKRKAVETGVRRGLIDKIIDFSITQNFDFRIGQFSIQLAHVLL